MTPPLPPGPKNAGFLTELPHLRRGVLPYFASLSRRHHEALLHIRFGQGESYIANHPDLVEEVLMRLPETMERSRWIGELRHLVEGGLLTCSEADWVPQRRRLRPAFSGHHGAVVEAAMRTETDALAERWRRAPGGTVDVQEDVKEALLRALVHIMLSPDLPVDERRIIADLDTLLQHISLRGQTWNAVVGRVGLGGRSARAVRDALERLDAFIYRAIDGCRSGELAAGLLLAALLPAEARGEVDARKLHDEVGTLLLAGFDTTAALVSFALWELAERPDLRAALRDEPGSPVLERVLSETLRLYPPAWAIYRTATAPVELGGYTIPKGDTVMVCLYALQRNPAFWTDPDRFRPERFAAGSEPRARFEYLPFSHGRHTCIGKRMALQQARQMVTDLTARFELTRAGRPPGLVAGVILRAAGGLPMRARPRA